MRICFIVRSLYTQLPNYTTTHLAYEAHMRKHRVAYTTVNGLAYRDDERVLATVVSIPSERPQSSRAAFLDALKSDHALREEVCLSDFDVVFLRHNPNDPESDSSRQSPALEFGRLLKNHGVFVINDPGGLAKASSKMYLSMMPPDIRARTLITRSSIKVKEFLRELKKPAVVKPLSGYGGQDVFFIRNRKEININQIISAVAKNGYVMVQEFLPEVKRGDKRLLLLNGSPIQIGPHTAMYRRMSPKGEIRSNIHIGGTRRTAEFTEIEAEIAHKIRPRLIADGLYFVGADIVGGKLLELNVFCPGGIHNINELFGINVGQYVITDLERRVRIWQMHQKTPSPIPLVKV